MFRNLDAIDGECRHPEASRIAWESASDDVEPRVRLQLCKRCGRTIKPKEFRLVDRLAKEVDAVKDALGLNGAP